MLECEPILLKVKPRLRCLLVFRVLKKLIDKMGPVRIQLFENLANSRIAVSQNGREVLAFCVDLFEKCNHRLGVTVSVPNTTGVARMSPLFAATCSSSILRAKSAFARASSLPFI